jgi:hypothetical protein
MCYTSSMRRPIVLIALVGSVVAGCSRGDDTADPTAAPVAPTATAPPAPTVAATPAPPPTPPATTAAVVTEPPVTTAPVTEPPDLSDLSPVCRDTGIAAATAYTATPGLHPVVAIAADDVSRVDSATELPAGWGFDEFEPERAELVACVTQVTATPTRLCEGFVDDDSGTSWSVQMHTATYEITVRAIATAEVLTTATVDRSERDCPLISSYTEGDPNPVPQYPRVRASDLETIVKPFVTGGAAPEELVAASPTVPAAELTTDDFHQVCRDTGQTSAVEFIAGPGLHPAVLLTTDHSGFSQYTAMFPALPEGWEGNTTPSAAQLVVCAVVTATTSNQICDGYTGDDGTALQVETFDTTYDVSVRVARTAEVLHAEPLTTPGTECPMFMTFTQTAGPEPYYPEPDPVALETLLKPFVNP